MVSNVFEKNTLYYGDNLEVLRKHFPPECIDLVYLDPPFNSKADYNVLFKEKTGKESVAQAQAFSDSWTWDRVAEETYMKIQENPSLGKMITFLHEYLGKNDFLAYLVMMTIRLNELHRVLKTTGSLYLHCDPTASHYLKIIMDAIFTPSNFRNEITWRRANAHNDPKKYGNISDILLFYTKSDSYTWNTVYLPYGEKYKESHWKRKDALGRAYRLMPLDAPKHGEGGNLVYKWHGKLPAPTRTWSCVVQKMKEYEAKGLLEYTSTGTPCLKKRLDEMQGAPLQNIWTDIPPVNPMALERQGYPTQKPIALLERIIQSSSNEGDLILDPFCGCGTTIMASQKLKRRWVGIDITHLAISLIRSRLKKVHVIVEKDYTIIGEPVDVAGAEKLAEDNKYQFQYWAVSLIDAFPVGQTSKSPYGKKGADKGIDGWLTFKEGDNIDLKRIVVQVKGGHNVGSGEVRDLVGTVQNTKSAMGILITLDEPTQPMKIAAMEAGYYESPIWGHEYPKIQISAIPDLLEGKKPKIPH
jgi:DNA modification methylase